ncbi:MAG: mechanosensitive ion channel [Proteobacteria bacterium]|nr:mechanosensitive ion channel [Pseudomonadota bacterium]
MQRFLDPDYLAAQWALVQTWFTEQVLVTSSLIQLVVIAVAFILAFAIAPWIRRGVTSIGKWRTGAPWLSTPCAAIASIALPLSWLLLVWISSVTALQAEWPHRLLTIAVSLLTAWVVIRLASTLIRDKTWSNTVSTIAWFIAALNILNLLDPTIKVLDDAAFTLGDVSISALTVIKGVLALAVLLWMATIISGMMERRISRSANLTPSVQVLFSKLLKVVLIAVAVVIALSSVGIDLTAFTVFTGALGVGVGFGLQKIVANLISGILILMDKSIKPGDVIEVGGTYGWVNSLGGRYASVVTRDGIEHLIPNEELITQRVSNWTHSSSQIRLKIPVGISYNADVRKAIELCIEAANEVERILSEPKAACLVKGFGDSSVDLEIRVWINDPKNGVSNVKSAVLLIVWDKFHEHGIEIPFPQRDLHIKSAEPLRIIEP